MHYLLAMFRNFGILTLRPKVYKVKGFYYKATNYFNCIIASIIQQLIGIIVAIRCDWELKPIDWIVGLFFYGRSGLEAIKSSKKKKLKKKHQSEKQRHDWPAY